MKNSKLTKSTAAFGLPEFFGIVVALAIVTALIIYVVGINQVGDNKLKERVKTNSNNNYTVICIESGYSNGEYHSVWTDQKTGRRIFVSSQGGAVLLPEQTIE